jgi:alpha-galactosidase
MKNITVVLVLLLANVASARAFSPSTNLTAREEMIVAAARADAAPQFNGAKIIGIHPGQPLIHSFAVSGERPLSFSAKKLPAGLKLDAQTGIITGAVARAGEYAFKVTAKNSAGKAATEIKIVCGDGLALTPPMGWNSYDAFGDAVVESEVVSNALWMKEHLQPFGWDTVVVDFRWYDSKADGVRVQNPEGVMLDEFGRCVPATNRFPSAMGGLGFKPLADQIHAMGLKFGIHIMRGIPRRAVEQDLPIYGADFRAAQAVRPVGDSARECKWNRDMFGVDATTDAGRAWYASIARQYAGWGLDFIKCDDIANLQRGTNRYPQAEVEALAGGLRASGRSIVLSLSPGPALVEQSPHLRQNANLWRISGDFWDNWPALDHNFELFVRWQTNGAPGHWPDGDMIPFGHICLRNCDVHPDRWTRFTRDEQVTLMALWALAPSPLMLGMNLPDNDAWTTALLTNPEVLAVNQDALGKPARRVFLPGLQAELWVRELADGSHAVGLFNRTSASAKLALNWKEAGFPPTPKIRDLWQRKDFPAKSGDFSVELPPHGSMLLRVN